MPRGGKRPGAGRPRIHTPQGDGPKRLPWRPSKYDPAFCEMLIDAMKAGYSLTGFAGLIGVARATLDNWSNEFPEFLNARNIGVTVRVACWEGHQNRVATSGGGPGTAQIIQFALKNMAPDEYREKQTLEHSGPGGGPVQVQRIERVIIDPSGQ